MIATKLCWSCFAEIRTGLFFWFDHFFFSWFFLFVFSADYSVSLIDTFIWISSDKIRIAFQTVKLTKNMIRGVSKKWHFRFPIEIKLKTMRLPKKQSIEISNKMQCRVQTRTRHAYKYVPVLPFVPQNLFLVISRTNEWSCWSLFVLLVNSFLFICPFADW